MTLPSLAGTMNTMIQTPSVGRIVHYVAYGTPGGEYQAGAHRAATITEVDAGAGQSVNAVGLCIMNPTGLFFGRQVPYAAPESNTPGSWHYPERVE